MITARLDRLGDAELADEPGEEDAARAAARIGDRARLGEGVPQLLRGRDVGARRAGRDREADQRPRQRPDASGDDQPGLDQRLHGAVDQHDDIGPLARGNAPLEDRRRSPNHLGRHPRGGLERGKNFLPKGDGHGERAHQLQRGVLSVRAGHSIVLRR
jgi:hypothetical protein